MKRLIAIILGALITLHSPSGQELFVNGDKIMIIREPIGCERGSAAEVTVHDKPLCVQEPPIVVRELVRKSQSHEST